MVDRFATVIYLDANGETMSEGDFVRALFDKHLPFDLKKRDD